MSPSSPMTSTKVYDTPSQKCKRKVSKVKTDEYLKVKRPSKLIKTDKHSPSSSSKMRKSAASTSIITPTAPLQQTSPSNTASQPSTQRQSAITSFLKDTNNTNAFPIEEYFHVPAPNLGFNIGSLRRHFYTMKHNANIIAVIMKTILNNNIIPWQPSTIPKTNTSRLSKRIKQSDANKLVQAQLNVIDVTCLDKNSSPIIVPFSPSSSLHRCYVEDFIMLPIKSEITILLPVRKNSKKTVTPPSYDVKFLKIIEEQEFEKTSIGGEKNIFHIIPATIISSPNLDQASCGIDRITFLQGLNGNSKFGCTVRVEGSNLEPLVKWRDVLNGRCTGLQVW